MDTVIRAVAIYLLLMLLFRISGKRPLARMNSFDAVLLLIIGEAASQGLIGDDFSIVNAALVIVTLVTMELMFSLLKYRSPRVDRWIDDVPVILVENGKVLRDRIAHGDDRHR